MHSWRTLAALLAFACRKHGAAKQQDEGWSDHALLRGVAAAMQRHRPLITERFWPAAGSLTSLETFAIECSHESLWERVAFASTHPWRSEEQRGSTYQREDGRTVVVGLRECDVCQVLNGGRVFDPPPKPGTQVMFLGSFNENWGEFSTYLPNHSVNWGNLTQILLECLPDTDEAPALDARFQPPGAPARRFIGMEGLLGFLDDERVLLWVSASHQASPPAPHAKLLSLPLGMKDMGAADTLWHELERHFAHGEPLPARTRLLAINNSGWEHRSAINALVNATFGGVLVNGYRSEESRKRFYEELLRSKFVLTPSGLGYDTYRLWEVMMHGAIPIIDPCPGFDRTFAGLPVLTVADWADVTPQLLERVYKEFTVDRLEEWDFSRLTQQYWLNMLGNAASSGNIDDITAQHPLRTVPHPARQRKRRRRNSSS